MLPFASLHLGVFALKLPVDILTSQMDTQPREAIVKESVRALLTGAIDYAGLFPPSQLTMSEAVLNYATYRNSNYAWMLGRFVVTAARLDEFYESAADFIQRDEHDRWHIAVVSGEDIVETLKQVEFFNLRHGDQAICDVLEVRATSVSKIENTVNGLRSGTTAYFEIPAGESMPDLIAALAARGQRAKIRTGGITPEAFPTPGQIVQFVRSCLAANVPFKATAGLHHPLRCFRPLTYEEGSVMGRMHGFLNLFLMTGFAREGYRANVLEDVMEEEFDEVFSFEPQAVTWRDFSLNVAQIESLRQKGIQSFGSCSFDEPVADLQKLGIL